MRDALEATTPALHYILLASSSQENSKTKKLTLMAIWFVIVPEVSIAKHTVKVMSQNLGTWFWLGGHFFEPGHSLAQLAMQRCLHTLIE